MLTRDDDRNSSDKNIGALSEDSSRFTDFRFNIDEGESENKYISSRAGSGSTAGKIFDNTNFKKQPKESNLSDLSNEYLINPVNYSSAYVKNRTSSFVFLIEENLSNWLTAGAEDGLVFVRDIKKFIERFSLYMDDREENRILLGILQLIFDGDNWQKLSESQIKFLNSELKRFKDGNVDWEQLSRFSKQIYQNNISLI